MIDTSEDDGEIYGFDAPQVARIKAMLDAFEAGRFNTLIGDGFLETPGIISTRLAKLTTPLPGRAGIVPGSGSGLVRTLTRVFDGAPPVSITDTDLAQFDTTTVYNVGLRDLLAGTYGVLARDPYTGANIFLAGGDDGDYVQDYVSEVCLLTTGSGGISLIVEHTVIDKDSGTILDVYCVVNPNNCCVSGSAATNDCVTCVNSNQICLTMSIGANLDGCACLDGFQVTLNYDPSSRSWGALARFTCGGRSGTITAAAFCLASTTTPLDEVWRRLALYFAYATDDGLCRGLFLNPGLDLNSHLSLPTSGTCGPPYTATYTGIAGGCCTPTGNTPAHMDFTVTVGGCSGGGGTVITSCCPAGMPKSLCLLLTNVAGVIGLGAGVQVTLVWNGTTWGGTITACASTITVSLSCAGASCSGFLLSVQFTCAGGGMLFTSGAPSLCDCTPSLTWNSIDGTAGGNTCCPAGVAPPSLKIGAVITGGACGGSGGHIVSCCTNPVPHALTLTLTSLVGCVCMAGSYTLTYSGASTWLGVVTLCGGIIVQMQLQCSGGVWRLVISNGPDDSVGPQVPDSIVCPPGMILTWNTLVFTNSIGTATCAGTMKGVVTS